jgi:threonine dehydrogenase-like Zn-dependent dehydrogenase
MKAIVYHGPRDFRVESVPDPKLLDPQDALVRITRTAICGSDLHLWHGSPAAASGFVTGHEFIGVIEDVGSGVRRVKRGDRVLVSCTAGCGECQLCRKREYSGCQTLGALGPATNVFGFGNPALNGGQAEAARVPFADTNLFRIPDSVDDEHALFLTDILPTGYMGAELAEVGPGDVVVVFGCGPVGTFAQRSALIRGAAAVVAVDLDEGRLARARERGCLPLNPERQDLRARVSSLTAGRGADAAIEAVGRAELVRNAIDVVRAGGRVAVIGVVSDGGDVPIPMMAGLMAKNLTLRSGLVNPQNQVPKLLPLIEQGRLDPTDIITHRLPLADGVRGYQVFDAHAENVLKVVLKP